MCLPQESNSIHYLLKLRKELGINKKNITQISSEGTGLTPRTAPMFYTSDIQTHLPELEQAHRNLDPRDFSSKNKKNLAEWEVDTPRWVVNQLGLLYAIIWVMHAGRQVPGYLHHFLFLDETDFLRPN